MEDNGVLGTLVNYLKNCNTPSISLLDLKVALFAMLMNGNKQKAPIVRNFKTIISLLHAH